MLYTYNPLNMSDTFNPLERPEDAFLEWLLSTQPELAQQLLRRAHLARHDLQQAGVNPVLIDGLNWFVQTAEERDDVTAGS